MTVSSSAYAPPLPSYTAEDLVRLDAQGLLDFLTGDKDRAPRALIDECARRGEEMVERLAPLVERDYYWQGGATRGEWWLLLHAVMILGLIPSEQAGLLLARLMRRMSEAEDFDLQGWLAGYWPALFANKPDSVLPALRELCADRSLDWYLRTNAMDPVVASAERRGQEALDETLDWVVGIASDEQEDWEMRLCCGNTLLDFPRPRYRALLEDLAARQRGIGVHFSAGDVVRAYAALKDEPNWRRRDDPWAFYRPQAIAGRQARWAREDAKENASASDDEVLSDEPALPYIRHTPKVGRNDPCPCGSGKKYKKCCLATNPDDR